MLWMNKGESRRQKRLNQQLYATLRELERVEEQIECAHAPA